MWTHHSLHILVDYMLDVITRGNDGKSNDKSRVAKYKKDRRPRSSKPNIEARNITTTETDRENEILRFIGTTKIKLQITGIQPSIQHSERLIGIQPEEIEFLHASEESLLSQIARCRHQRPEVENTEDTKKPEKLDKKNKKKAWLTQMQYYT